jgi:hypothetical protein
MIFCVCTMNCHKYNLVMQWNALQSLQSNNILRNFQQKRNIFTKGIRNMQCKEFVLSGMYTLTLSVAHWSECYKLIQAHVILMETGSCINVMCYVRKELCVVLVVDISQMCIFLACSALCPVVGSTILKLIISMQNFRSIVCFLDSEWTQTCFHIIGFQCLHHLVHLSLTLCSVMLFQFSYAHWTTYI